MTTPPPTGDHARLMDSIYRHQRHLYDVTRKYYLFGRDGTLRDLRLPGRGEDSAVLEIGCGTGRNLAEVRRRWPEARLFGIDISAEMLKSAQGRLGTGAVLAIGDAARFDAAALLGRDRFDRVVMPYCLSMIPAWREAIDHACGLLAPGGSLHIVDFADMTGMPSAIRSILRAWLARFHVAPRSDLIAQCHQAAAHHNLACRAQTALGGYYQAVVLARPGASPPRR